MTDSAGPEKQRADFLVMMSPLLMLMSVRNMSVTASSHAGAQPAPLGALLMHFKNHPCKPPPVGSESTFPEGRKLLSLPVLCSLPAELRISSWSRDIRPELLRPV